ncbi:MAG: hypothetical protein ACYCQJ_07795 [Nitrososphaerales archaeon]
MSGKAPDESSLVVGRFSSCPVCEELLKQTIFSAVVSKIGRKVTGTLRFRNDISEATYKRHLEEKHGLTA